MKPKTIMLLYKQEKAEFEHFFSIELRIKLAKLANVHSFSLKREGEDSEQDTLCCLIFIEYIANSAAVTGHFFYVGCLLRVSRSRKNYRGPTLLSLLSI